MSGYYDSSFMLETEIVGTVYQAFQQSSGKYLLNYQIESPFVVRVTIDGEDDGTFVFPVLTGTSPDTANIKLKPDDGFIVGGRFDTIDGESITKYAVLDLDATVDTGFSTSGTSATARPLLVLASGKYLMEIGTPPLLKRVNTDGTTDGAFTPGIFKYNFSDTADSDLYALAEDSSNNIVITGNFFYVGATARSSIARISSTGTLDGSFDPNITLGVSNGQYLTGLFIQADGKILVGGNFDEVGGTARPGLARLNDDGTLDTGFDPPAITFLGYPYISQVEELADGKVFITGNFSDVDGELRTGLARLNSDGSLDTDYEPPVMQKIVPETDPVEYLPAVLYGFVPLAGNDVVVYGRFDTPGYNVVRLTELPPPTCFWTGLVNADQVC